MSILQPLDPDFSIENQLSVDVSPVILVNIFKLNKEDEEEFLRVWRDDAIFMKRQTGFISTQLHRAIGESIVYLNYAIWESNECFRQAFKHPEFISKLSQYPSSASCTPHLFKKIAIPDICIA